MSSEARRVKIFTLLSLACGVALAVYGLVVVFTQNLGTAGYCLAGEGLLTAIFGARAALLVNVPAHIGQIVNKALIVMLVQIVSVTSVVLIIGTDHVGENSVTVALAVVPVFLSLAILLMSRGIAKRAER